MRNASQLQPVHSRVSRTKEELLELEAHRQKWLSAIPAASTFHKLFDYIPGVFFFAKDRRGRTMFASRGILELYHMSHESEMLGLTDYDLNPSFMAENYIRDDQRIFSGELLHLERLELWFDGLGMPDWFVVTKLPITLSNGSVDGVMGILRRASENDKQLPVFQTVARAVELIRRNYATSLRMSDIAESCGQSLRQLQRHFQSAFGATPQEFLLRTRILVATRLLQETRLGLAEIAERCGFLDASAFAQQFRIRTRQTPSAYRSSHLAEAHTASTAPQLNSALKKRARSSSPGEKRRKT